MVDCVFFHAHSTQNHPSRKLCFPQLKIDPECQFEIDPPYITQNPVCYIDNCSHFSPFDKTSRLALWRSLVW